MSIRPTDENLAILDLFNTGADLGIFALAGTGKTTALILLAGQDRGRPCRYAAFNKKLTQEAKGRFPANTKVSTIHSIAMRKVGYQYKHRLGGQRRRSFEYVGAMGAKSFRVDSGPFNYIALQPWQVVNIVFGTVNEFCKSDAADILPEHVPWVPNLDRKTPPPSIALSGAQSTLFSVEAADAGEQPNRAHLIETVLPMAQKVWKDVQDPSSDTFPFTHSHYLKIFERSSPVIDDADVILLDEGQDVQPVMESCFLQQRGRAQLVICGDEHQEIFSWAGARSALSRFPTEARGYLTLSWRFGAEIAHFANLFLTMLESNIFLTGNPDRTSRIERLNDPDCILTRTNGRAVAILLECREIGKPATLVGDSKDIKDFCRASLDLKMGREVSHPELIGFATWDDVVKYASEDELGADLKLMVELIQRYGAAAILKTLDMMPAPGPGVLSVSTIHKAKGLEWDTVQVAGDIPWEDLQENMIEPEEIRLLYVAVTRARYVLDPGPALMGALVRRSDISRQTASAYFREPGVLSAAN